VTVGPVVVKTIAAILVVTVSAKIKMGAAEILVANRTRPRRLSITDETLKRIGGETIRKRINK
jgi:hypothetical protein